MKNVHRNTKTALLHLQDFSLSCQDSSKTKHGNSFSCSLFQNSHVYLPFRNASGQTDDSFLMLVNKTTDKTGNTTAVVSTPCTCAP